MSRPGTSLRGYRLASFLDDGCPVPPSSSSSVAPLDEFNGTLDGVEGGLGHYSVTDPCTGKKETGLYAHVSFSIKGRHYAVGIGTSVPSVP